MLHPHVTPTILYSVQIGTPKSYGFEDAADTHDKPWTTGFFKTTVGGPVFVGATNDRRFRAIDSRTGKELWTVKLDYNAISVPMTYQGKDGKQYVAIVADDGGAGVTDPSPGNNGSLVVFALP